MTDGIKIVKKDRNIGSTNESDFVVDSDTPLLKIYQIVRGSYNFSYPADNFVPQTVIHALGYTPAFLMFMERNPGSNNLLVTSQDEDFDDTLLAGNKQILVNATADTEGIVFTVSGAPSQPTHTGIYNYTIMIFYDEAAEGDL